MKLKTTSLYLLFIAFAAFFTKVHAENSPIINNPGLLAYAQEQLPHHGILTKKENGFTYLKVDDAYIHALFELLEEKNIAKPAYFRRADAPGAHVSVLYEAETRHLNGIPQLDEVFHFQIKELALVRARRNTFIILRVISPELERYRMSLGLSPRLQNHDFHITIAKKTK